MHLRCGTQNTSNISFRPPIRARRALPHSHQKLTSLVAGNLEQSRHKTFLRSPLFATTP